MKSQTRRFLDEEWLEEHEIEELKEERERRNDDRPPPDPRAIKSREWGKQHAKFHRQRKKQGMQKPNGQ